MGVCVGDKESSRQAGSLLTTDNGAEPLESELRPDGLCVGNPSFGGITNNGAYGIRTHGLHNANVARSQLR